MSPQLAIVCSRLSGAACAKCAEQYYRLEAKCMKCPARAYMVMVTYAVVVLLVAAFVVLCQRMRVSLSALGIGIDFVQVVSLFSSFGFAWPSELTKLFKAASSFSSTPLCQAW